METRPGEPMQSARMRGENESAPDFNRRQNAEDIGSVLAMSLSEGKSREEVETFLKNQLDSFYEKNKSN